MSAPFGVLKYLYVGVASFEKDLAYYRDVLGARLVWNLEGFGAHVAAFELGPGPLVLLADHRPKGSLILIYNVDNLAASMKRLEAQGWKKTSGPFEVPDGPCVTFRDPNGVEYGLLQPDRPDALVREHEVGPGLNPPKKATRRR